MNPATVLLLCGCVVGAGAAELPVFEAKLDARLDLSSSGVIQLRREFATLPLPRVASVAMDRRQAVSRMPILRPDESVDLKLRMVEPEASKDYTLIVKEPEFDLE